ncbi:hypothetical protein Dsin_011173 [Dipteronia sinensis]|uniref:RNase H type-1 domain-containing protein n=1 Tax=Dipteronia sinensis TaxID=43782 RepID=A0AAE0AUM7_9ROSI|nr:hypothetical protein Dsin_011173 [Dipteronia sinensis]
MEKQLGCLAARILRSIYYPTSSFMRADKSKSGSMVWKGLCWGRDLLDVGSRMRIGSGSAVSRTSGFLAEQPFRFLHRRNKLVHGKDRVGLDSVVSWCRGYISDWLAANCPPDQAASGAQEARGIRWKPPTSGTYKLNIDAALEVQHLPVGLGTVIRDHMGFVMASSAQRVEANFTPQIAEAMAISRGLKFAVDSGLFPIMVESDALEIVKLDIFRGRDTCGYWFRCGRQ